VEEQVWGIGEMILTCCNWSTRRETCRSVTLFTTNLR